jgi:hypothetical protein
MSLFNVLGYKMLFGFLVQMVFEKNVKSNWFVFDAIAVWRYFRIFFLDKNL